MADADRVLWEMELIEGRRLSGVGGYTENEVFVEPGWNWHVVDSPHPLDPGRETAEIVVVRVRQIPSGFLLLSPGYEPSTLKDGTSQDAIAESAQNARARERDRVFSFSLLFLSSFSPPTLPFSL